MEQKRRVFTAKSYAFIDKWKGRDDYLADPAALAQALGEYEQWRADCGTSGDEGYYFDLRTSQDENSPELKAKANKIDELATKILNDIQFFEMKIAKIPQETQKTFLEDARLAGYRHFLERLFEAAKHLLSDQEERILNLKETPAYSNWVKMTSGFLAKETREVLLDDGSVAAKSFSEIISLIDSPSKPVRDGAAAALNGMFAKHGDAAEAEMNSILADKKINDELRGFSRPDQVRHLSDDIDSETVDMVISAVAERFDIPRRYYELKAKLLGVPQLAYHERNVPYGRVEKQYDFETAAGLVQRVFGKLDGRFAEIFEGFLANGQIDVFPRQGKRHGAFCAYNNLSQPTYVLLNHTDKLQDVLTLAHEMGHAINDELMREKQNALNFATPVSTAEVASTFMEDFVLEEIMAEADDELKLSLMMMKLNNDVSSIFRQAACYRFEYGLHTTFRQTGYVSKEAIGTIFAEHMSAYMGPAVEQSAGSENWWVYWAHIRRFFYVYSYASGLLISKSLQKSVKENHEHIGKVKDFLATGRADSPKNIFKKLDINITDRTFWDDGLKEVESLLVRTEELARKLGKIK
jgi:oligoendopeptidase F